MEVRKIDHAEFKRLIKRFYSMQKKRALFVQGRYGIGKSAVVRETAKEIASELNKEFVVFNEASKEVKDNVFSNPEKYFVLVDIRLLEYSPEDIKGMPRYDNQAMVWELFREMKVLTIPNIHGILFLDEINNAPQMIQMVAYKILLDRVIGDYPISENVSVVAAGNTTEDAPVFELLQPLRNRMFIYELVPSEFEKWKEWALSIGIDSRIITFLDSPIGRKLFTVYREEGISITPRSWEFASDAILGVNDLNEIELYISGIIGYGASKEFVAFLRLWENKYDIKEMLRNPRTARLPSEKEVDVLYSVIASLAESVRENVANLKSVAIIASRLRGDFSLLLIRLARSILNSKGMFISEELQKYSNVPEIKKLLDNISKWFMMR